MRIWVWTEVEQQADLEDGPAEIPDELWPGGWCQSLGSLAFDDHAIVNHHVQPLPRNG